MLEMAASPPMRKRVTSLKSEPPVPEFDLKILNMPTGAGYPYTFNFQSIAAKRRYGYDES